MNSRNLPWEQLTFCFLVYLAMGLSLSHLPFWAAFATVGVSVGIALAVVVWLGFLHFSLLKAKAIIFAVFMVGAVAFPVAKASAKDLTLNLAVAGLIAITGTGISQVVPETAWELLISFSKKHTFVILAFTCLSGIGIGWLLQKLGSLL